MSKNVYLKEAYFDSLKPILNKKGIIEEINIFFRVNYYTGEFKKEMMSDHSSYFDREYHNFTFLIKFNILNDEKENFLKNVELDKTTKDISKEKIVEFMKEVEELAFHKLHLFEEGIKKDINMINNTLFSSQKMKISKYVKNGERNKYAIYFKKEKLDLSIFYNNDKEKIENMTSVFLDNRYPRTYDFNLGEDGYDYERKNFPSEIKMKLLLQQK